MTELDKCRLNYSSSTFLRYNSKYGCDLSRRLSHWLSLMEGKLGNIEIGEHKEPGNYKGLPLRWTPSPCDFVA